MVKATTDELILEELQQLVDNGATVKISNEWKPLGTCIAGLAYNNDQLYNLPMNEYIKITIYRDSTVADIVEKLILARRKLANREEYHKKNTFYEFLKRNLKLEVEK